MADIVTSEDTRNGLDKLTDEALLNGDLDEGAREETESASAAPPEPTVKQSDFDALKRSNDDLRAQSEITNRYLQGLLAQRQAIPEAPSQPKGLELNFDEIAEQVAQGGKPGVQALVDLVTKVIKYEREDIERTVDSRANMRQSARDMQSRRTQQFQSEVNDLATRYGDLWNSDDFKAACDKEALDILHSRGGSRITDFQPGDLKAAAKSVYADWKAEGKLPQSTKQPQPSPPPTLREIIRRQPRSDDIGNGNNRRSSGKPRSIAELYPDDARLQDQCRVVAKKLGVSESDFVEQTLAAGADDEDYGK